MPAFANAADHAGAVVISPGNELYLTAQHDVKIVTRRVLLVDILTGGSRNDFAGRCNIIKFIRGYVPEQ